MRSRLTVVALMSTLLIMAASMAVVYKLIPLQAAGLISIIGMVIIAVVVSRCRPGAVQESSAERKTAGVLPTIWPLLLGAVAGIFGVWKNGWRIGDTIGAVVCFLLLTGYILVFRKRGAGSSHRG
jgi:uncharacterized membrane protein